MDRDKEKDIFELVEAEMQKRLDAQERIVVLLEEVSQDNDDQISSALSQIVEKHRSWISLMKLENLMVGSLVKMMNHVDSIKRKNDDEES